MARARPEGEGRVRDPHPTGPVRDQAPWIRPPWWYVPLGVAGRLRTRAAGLPAKRKCWNVTHSTALLVYIIEGEGGKGSAVADPGEGG